MAELKRIEEELPARNKPLGKTQPVPKPPFPPQLFRHQCGPELAQSMVSIQTSNDWPSGARPPRGLPHASVTRLMAGGPAVITDHEARYVHRLKVR